MKNKTILSLFIALIVIAVVAIQLHKEAKADIAETADTQIDVTINSTDGQLHGIYNVSLINITQHNVTAFLRMKSKIGTYPSVHGGGFPFLRDDWFILQGCSDEGWGFLQSQPFQMVDGETMRFTFTAGSRCMSYAFKND